MCARNFLHFTVQSCGTQNDSHVYKLCLKIKCIMMLVVKHNVVFLMVKKVSIKKIVSVFALRWHHLQHMIF